MPTIEIEEFAKKLVVEVRDAAIQSSDRELQPNAGSPVAIRWKESAIDGQIEAIAKTLIPDIVDDTIFYLLQAIDQGLLKLSFTDSNGKTIDLEKDGFGELSGWYMGSDGWRKMYSKERFVDDFADLT
ncbi:hypothetical protein GMSM_24690 [Geomonas sp. Red276]